MLCHLKVCHGHDGRDYQSENRAPTTHELGGNGETKQVMLELRVMAQVGVACFDQFSCLKKVTQRKLMSVEFVFSLLHSFVELVKQ